jgi:hypothetical protein
MFSKESWVDSQKNLAGNSYEFEMDSLRGPKKEISNRVWEKFVMEFEME